MADLIGKPNFEIVRHDVTKDFFVEVDQIYNMACPASPVHYQYNPVKTMKTSVAPPLCEEDLCDEDLGSGPVLWPPTLCSALAPALPLPQLCPCPIS